MFNYKKYIKGQVRLEITGWGSERLLKLCKKNNIEIYNFQIIENGFDMIVTNKDYRKIQSFNKKTKSTIKEIDKNGLPNFLYKYKKRKIFIICLIISIISIFIFSNFIWNISIIGNESYTKEELTKIIKDNYVSIGAKKKDVNCNILEKELREKFDNISWISCEKKGTNLIIHIQETIPNDKPIKYTKPCNIISYKDAIITEIITNKGDKIVSKGDHVKKNDILITGVVNITNEYDELIETNYISAQGTVLGIVEYDYNDSFPLETSKKIYTDKSNNSISINIFGKSIKMPTKSKYKLCDTISYEKNISLFENLYLPFGYTTYKVKEYTISNITYSPEEAYEIANKRLIEYIEKLKKKGVSIMENNVKITIVNDVCVASGTIKCKEAIGIPSEIEILNEGE